MNIRSILLVFLIFYAVSSAQEVRKGVVSYGVRPDNFDLTQNPTDKSARLKEPLIVTYPDEAMRKRFQGTAIIAAAINEKGNVVYAEVQHSSGFANLDSSALHAVKEGYFIAAQREEKPVPSRITIPVEFKIEKDKDEYNVPKSVEQLESEAKELERAKKMLEEEQRNLEEELRKLKEQPKK